MMRSSAALLLWSCLCGLSQAGTTIYRCGPGQREYSEAPCLGGTVLEGTDGRSAAQRAAAVRVTEDEQRKAVGLERERRAEQRLRKAAAAAGIDGLAKPAKKAASTPESGSKKWIAGKVKSRAKTPKPLVIGEPKANN
ncbi:MAG: hypothetical protein JHC40_13020 [Burkholderiales bacterium]|jgi:hypothetical protein|nr:hypothetical protein [Burkholderiales bacterium]